MRIWPFNRPGDGESLRQPLPVARLVAFALVGLFCFGYLLFSVVGIKTFKGQYDVKVDLVASGGLFPGSQVTYRGVPVGTVTAIDVNPAKDGVVASLQIHGDVDVPAQTLAVVADRSPAGEQYLDLQPTAAGPPYLAQVGEIDRAHTRLPPSLTELLNSVSAFSGSVNVGELRTVFRELDLALGGSGPALGQLIDNTAEIVSTLQGVAPQTIDLLDNAGKLLGTQTAHGADLHRFSVSLRQLADTLRADDPKTVKLVAVALATSKQVGPLLRKDAGYISALLRNLVTVGGLINDRLPGLRVLLRTVPLGLAALASGVHGGHVSFKLLTQTGRACPYRTRRQDPWVLNRKSSLRNAFCTKPPPQTQQRGAVNAPRPPGDTTAGPPSGNIGSGSSSKRATPATRAGHHSRAHSWINIFGAGES